MSRFRVGELEVDFKTARAHRAGRAVDLAPRELRLLRYLIDRRGEVVSRGDILADIWEAPRSSPTRTVDVHVAKLRKKLERTPRRPAILVTVRGAGYTLK